MLANTSMRVCSLRPEANDQLTSDSYDANGNAIASGGLNYAYDFENHLVQKGGLTIVYDGDGNRVSKTTPNGTTQYLMDDVNPTGYAQVLDEVQNGRRCSDLHLWSRANCTESATTFAESAAG